MVVHSQYTAGMGSAVPLAVLVVVAVVVLVAIRRGSRMPKACRHGAICANCGYGYSGWQICPECGRSAAHSGVLTPALWTKFRVDPSGVVLGWLFVGLVSAGVMSDIADHLIELAGYTKIDVWHSADASDANNRPVRFIIEVEGLQMRNVVRDGTMRVVLHGDANPSPAIWSLGPVASAEFDYKSGKVTILDRSGHSVAMYDGFTPLAVAALYAAGGYGDDNPIHPSAEETSKSLADSSNNWRGTLSGFRASSSVQRTSIPALPVPIFGHYGPYHRWVILALGVVLAFLGVRWSLRKRAEAFAFAAKPSAPSPNQ